MEFVADRVASNYIKSFRSKTLPQALKLAYCQAKRLALQVYSTHDDKGKVRVQQLVHRCTHSCKVIQVV